MWGLDAYIFVRELYDTYDPRFVSMLGIQYFNQGFAYLVSLASQDLFKTVYKLEPSEAQKLSSIIALPWAIKILYGLITDNFPICGSRRKSYLLIGALIYTVSMNAMVYN